jgi:hypothetical protein
MPKSRSARLHRAAPAVAVAAALAALLAGCSSSGGQGAASNPLPSSSPSISAGPGSLTVVAPSIHLVITDAKITSTSNGGATLSMTVLNSGTATEHLTSVNGPGGWATLSGTQVSAAGILLPVGTSVGIGGTNEPQIALKQAPTASPGGTEQVSVLFALAGQVTLQAVVSH